MFSIIIASNSPFKKVIPKCSDYVNLIMPIMDVPLRPWPNDSIFHSIFSSTFDLKVERLLSVVEHM